MQQYKRDNYKNISLDNTWTWKFVDMFEQPKGKQQKMETFLKTHVNEDGNMTL